MLTRSLFLLAEPLLGGHQNELSIQSMLIRLATEKASGVLVLSPSGAHIHLRQGLIEALEGVESLPEILTRGGKLRPEQLAGLDVGATDFRQRLVRQGLLSTEALMDALRQQVRSGLSFLLKLQNQHYALYRHSPLLSPTAALPVAQALLEATDHQAPPPLEQPLRLAPNEGLLVLDDEEWSLLRWLNGRRTLGAALGLSGLSEAKGHMVAKNLLSKGLLEPAAVQGLRLIVPERAQLGSNYHPPASIKANLFLRACDGDRTAWQVSQEVRVSTEETATLLCMLYREGLLNISRGQREFEALMDEY